MVGEEVFTLRFYGRDFAVELFFGLLCLWDDGDGDLRVWDVDLGHGV